MHTGRAPEEMEELVRGLARAFHASRLTSFPHLAWSLFQAKLEMINTAYFRIIFKDHGLVFALDEALGGTVREICLRLTPSNEDIQIWSASESRWVSGPHWANIRDTFLPWFSKVAQTDALRNARTPEEEAVARALETNVLSWFRARGGTPPTAADGPFVPGRGPRGG